MALIENEVKSENGNDVTIYIEVDEDTYAVERGYDYDGEGTRGTHEKAKEAFSKAMSLIHTCAEQVTQSIKSIPAGCQPKEVEVQFSVKVNSEVGAVIAKAQTEAQFQVTLKWGKEG